MRKRKLLSLSVMPLGPELWVHISNPKVAAPAWCRRQGSLSRDHDSPSILSIQNLEYMFQNKKGYQPKRVTL